MASIGRGWRGQSELMRERMGGGRFRRFGAGGTGGGGARLGSIGSASDMRPGRLREGEREGMERDTDTETDEIEIERE